MQDLLAEQGPSYDINLRVFYDLQRTITGWPGAGLEARVLCGSSQQLAGGQAGGYLRPAVSACRVPAWLAAIIGSSLA